VFGFRSLTQSLLNGPFADIDGLASSLLQLRNNPTNSPIAGATVSLASRKSALAPSGLGVVLDSDLPANMNEPAGIILASAVRVNLTLARPTPQ